MPHPPTPETSAEYMMPVMPDVIGYLRDRSQVLARHQPRRSPRVERWLHWLFWGLVAALAWLGVWASHAEAQPPKQTKTQQTPQLMTPMAAPRTLVSPQVWPQDT